MVQVVCSLKDDICEAVQLVNDVEKNTVTINPEKCLECPFLEEKIKRAIIVLSGSPIPELYKKTSMFMIDFDLQVPRRIMQTKQ
ncbi:MAG: hypothetical protein ACUVXA_19740 [Candidatus Jordarchaeum sp.]|uniref:hypothetical protein n=1 Tax=Candidatus Jordarchaeum sp. TaxID=2823881 RepID=UPI0040493FBE